MQPTSDTPSPRSVSAGRRRILAVDALRLFSILTVIAIHCFMPLRDALPADRRIFIIDDVLHYAVPVFVFISGALVWARPWKGGPGAYRRFTSARLRAVALPYLAWALLYLLLGMARSADPLSVLAQAPALILSGHVWYHLYFVPMLLAFYALTPVANRALRRSPELTVLGAYAIRLLLWPAVSPALHAAAPDLLWSWGAHVAAHLPHMALGAWFALRLAAFPAWFRKAGPAALAAGLGGLIALSAGALTLLPSALRNPVHAGAMATFVVGLALWAVALEPHFDRFSHAIVEGAALSFGVYLVHPIVLEVLRAATRATDSEALWLRGWAFPASWAIITTVSFAASWLLLRSSRTSWLVGARTGAGG